MAVLRMSTEELSRVETLMHVVAGRMTVTQAARLMSVSRRHARFFEQDGRTWVEDLGSTNGILVNGQRVTKSRIGEVKLIRRKPSGWHGTSRYG